MDDDEKNKNLEKHVSRQSIANFFNDRTLPKSPWV
jgi:hypothetical protein